MKTSYTDAERMLSQIKGKFTKRDEKKELHTLPLHMRSPPFWKDLFCLFVFLCVLFSLFCFATCSYMQCVFQHFFVNEYPKFVFSVFLFLLYHSLSYRSQLELSLFYHWSLKLYLFLIVPGGEKLKLIVFIPNTNKIDQIY